MRELVNTFDESGKPARLQDDIRIVCWSNGEMQVLVQVNGKKGQWFRVEYVGSNPDVAMNPGFIVVNGKRIQVFA